jgi:hypothetical protein
LAGLALVLVALLATLGNIIFSALDAWRVSFETNDLSSLHTASAQLVTLFQKRKVYQNRAIV